jgi:hypothetical protein
MAGINGNRSILVGVDQRASVGLDTTIGEIWAPLNSLVTAAARQLTPMTLGLGLGLTLNPTLSSTRNTMSPRLGFPTFGASAFLRWRGGPSAWWRCRMSRDEVSKIIGVLVILYLAALLGIARHLKVKHCAVWESLGSPRVFNWSISSSFKLGNYVLLRDAHRRLTDQRLTFAIYAMRILILIIILIIAFWKLYY